LRIEELGERWSGVLGIAGQVVAGHAGSGILGVRDPAEVQLLDHEARHDLLITGELILGLVLHQLRLADKKRDQPQPLLRELVVDVSQPLQRVLG